MKGVIVPWALLALVSASPSMAQTGCTPVAPGVQDGTFEAGDPWPLWTVQTSTNFFTPLCDLAFFCGTGNGTAPPYAGSNWAWFGGADAPEESSAGQAIVIPGGSFLFLHFQLRIGSVSPPFTDVLTVSVDGVPLAAYPEPSSPEPAYTERFVNVTAFANNGSHDLLFSYVGPTVGIGNFTVDNVELLTCATPVELQSFSVS